MIAATYSRVEVMTYRVVTVGGCRVEVSVSPESRQWVIRGGGRSLLFDYCLVPIEGGRCVLYQACYESRGPGIGRRPYKELAVIVSDWPRVGGGLSIGRFVVESGACISRHQASAVQSSVSGSINQSLSRYFRQAK